MRASLSAQPACACAKSSAPCLGLRVLKFDACARCASSRWDGLRLYCCSNSNTYSNQGAAEQGHVLLVTIRSGWVSVSGFTVTGAIGEGILATGSLEDGSISHVSITGNHVTGNDTGEAQSPNSAYPQCNPAGPVPGDCGEGMHLMGVYDSVVSGNYDNGNSGGVLLHGRVRTHA